MESTPVAAHYTDPRAGPTGDQNPALQLAALKKEGCEKIFTDKLSGALHQRPELDKCLKKLNPGDVLVV